MKRHWWKECHHREDKHCGQEDEEVIHVDVSRHVASSTRARF